MSTAPALDVAVQHTHPGGFRLDVRLELGALRAVLFGPSGSGKSSLLRLIAGLERPDSGTIRLFGETLTDTASGVAVPLHQRPIGLIFQDDRLFPHLSVAENIAFGLHRLDRAARRARLAAVAALCGVEPLLKRHPAGLSGGERQRVGLARALAPRPRLLLCDEPVSALDIEARYLLVDRLRQIQESERIPLVYVTHAPAEALTIGQTMLRMRGGRIVDQGHPLEVLSRSADPVAAADGLVNLVHGTILESQGDPGSTRLCVGPGLDLRVPWCGGRPGEDHLVLIRAEEILLATGPLAGLSARNVIAGRIERIVPHGHDVEVVVAAGGREWVASLVPGAVADLALHAGAPVSMIIKARSCHVLTGRSSLP